MTSTVEKPAKRPRSKADQQAITVICTFFASILGIALAAVMLGLLS
jgi:hypothetical protein